MCSPFPRVRAPATAGFCPRASPESPFPFCIQLSCAQPTRPGPAYQPISASLLRSRFRRSRLHKAAFSAYSPGLFSRWQQFFICLHSGRIAAQTRISPPEMVIRSPERRQSAGGHVRTFSPQWIWKYSFCPRTAFGTAVRNPADESPHIRHSRYSPSHRPADHEAQSTWFWARNKYTGI